MSLAAGTVWEVRSTGSDSNGGGFVAGASGTDYSQQDAAQFSGTNLAVDAVTNTKVTSATHNFVATDVGNLIQITAGAGWTTGFYQIVSVAGNAATLDRSPAATGATGGTWAEGGALASPGFAQASINTINVADMIVWVRSGTYLMNASSNVAGGRITVSTRTHWRGYGTTRGDGGKPIFKANANSVAVVTQNVSFWSMRDFEIDGNKANFTNTIGITSSGGSNSRIVRCTVHDCGSTGVQSAGGFAVLCDAYANGGDGFATISCHQCISHNNAARGFKSNQNQVDFTECLAYNNTFAGFESSFSTTMKDCVAYNNSAGGFNCGQPSDCLINCVAYGNTGWGFASGVASTVMINCGGGGNSSGDIQNAVQSSGFVSLAADPFMSKGSAPSGSAFSAGESALQLAFLALNNGFNLNTARIKFAAQDLVGPLERP
jgi:hypothetical protein